MLFFETEQYFGETPTQVEKLTISKLENLLVQARGGQHSELHGGPQKAALPSSNAHRSYLVLQDTEGPEMLHFQQAPWGGPHCRSEDHTQYQGSKFLGDVQFLSGIGSGCAFSYCSLNQLYTFYTL